MRLGAFVSAWSDATDAELDRLYARVPDINCRGECWSACGPIDAGPAEKLRMRKAGVKLPPRDVAVRKLLDDGDYECPALDDGRCSVYSVRPMICRWWGAMADFRCPWGCLPDDGELLQEAEALELLDAANKVGTPQRVVTAAEFAEVLARDPRTREVYRLLIRDNQPTVAP
jgi:Fe-S-cluster containining protein